MRQRVGLARALVVQPDALFMDEPFSALDVLTAENLRNEIIELWTKGQFSAKSVLIVTHNIEEAVYLADRIVVLGSSPGTLRAVIKNDLPHWRNRKSAEFTGMVDQIYQIMTHPEANVAELLVSYRRHQTAEVAFAGMAAERGDDDGEAERVAQVSLGSNSEEAQNFRLPPARVDGLTGLVEYLDEQGGKDDIYRLADELHFEVDDLLPITDALAFLDLAEVNEGDINLTGKGQAFSRGELEERKSVFRQQMLATVPLADNIYQSLSGRPNHRIEVDFFREVLERRFTPPEATRQLEQLIDWGRYAELFEYDADAGILYLPPENNADLAQ
jgi:NitT/TauT family transport system ATP-binding protein